MTLSRSMMISMSRKAASCCVAARLGSAFFSTISCSSVGAGWRSHRSGGVAGRHAWRPAVSGALRRVLDAFFRVDLTAFGAPAPDRLT